MKNTRLIGTRGQASPLVVLALLFAIAVALSAQDSRAPSGMASLFFQESTATSEQITCYFTGSFAASPQNCYTADGKFSCSGTGTCMVAVEGSSGYKVDWKSSCGGYATTVIDGTGESITFNCEPSQQPAATSADIKEQVTCKFLNSGSPQKCRTTNGKFSCDGTGTCTAEVYGASGTKFEWDSTCSGYASTTVDGINKTITFECPQASGTPTETQTQSTSPYSCPSNCVCLAEADGKNLGYSFCGGTPTVCSYDQYKVPKYCYYAGQKAEPRANTYPSATQQQLTTQDLTLMAVLYAYYTENCGQACEDARKFLAEMKAKYSPNFIYSEGVLHASDIRSENDQKILDVLGMTIKDTTPTIAIGSKLLHKLDTEQIEQTIKECIDNPGSCGPVPSVLEPFAASPPKMYVAGQPQTSRQQNQVPPSGPCKEGSTAYYTCPANRVGEQPQMPWCVCKIDAWQCDPRPESACPPVDACPAKIDMELDKKVYYPGDAAKLSVKIYDSSGKPLPNQAFYQHTYSPSGAFKPQSTNFAMRVGKDGTYTSEGRIPSDLPPGRVITGAYTMGYEAWCASVNDNFEFEIADSAALQPVCGNGVCEPGEGQTCTVAAVACKPDTVCEIPKPSCSVPCPQDCYSKPTVQSTTLHAAENKFKLSINQTVSFGEPNNLSLTLVNVIVPQCKELRAEQPKSVLETEQPRPALERPAVPVPEEKPPATAPAGQTMEKARDKVKLYLFYWDECKLCGAVKDFLAQLKQRDPRIDYELYNAKAQEGAYQLRIVSYLKEGAPTVFLDDRAWTGYNDSIVAEIEKKISDCFNEGCALGPTVQPDYSAISAATGQVVAATPASAAASGGGVISTQSTVEACSGRPYAIVKVLSSGRESEMKLALGEKRTIAGVESMNIIFLDYDRGSGTGVFVVENAQASPMPSCPQNCSCDAYGKPIECRSAQEKCPAGTILCPDGSCGQSCTITDAVKGCSSGCIYADKCLPFGMRVEGKYCSIKGDLLKQLGGDDAACENNFECSTNLCVGEKCVSQGFIEMVIDWFKKLFGLG
ncbi:MAG: hypothetical protein V1676_02240 [Candidatus Diapherotrites archaeon]